MCLSVCCFLLFLGVPWRFISWIRDPGKQRWPARTVEAVATFRLIRGLVRRLPARTVTCTLLIVAPGSPRATLAPPTAQPRPPAP